MSFSLFPIDDRDLTTRLKRQLMGFMSYMMFLVPLGYSAQQGWLRIGYQGMSVILALALVINIGFLVAIRSRATRRFKDPSLMMAQIAIAGCMASSSTKRWSSC
jgi:hypothetical protein